MVHRLIPMVNGCLAVTSERHHLRDQALPSGRFALLVGGIERTSAIQQQLQSIDFETWRFDSLADADSTLITGLGKMSWRSFIT